MIDDINAAQYMQNLRWSYKRTRYVRNCDRVWIDLEMTKCVGDRPVRPKQKPLYCSLWSRTKAAGCYADPFDEDLDEVGTVSMRLSKLLRTAQVPYDRVPALSCSNVVELRGIEPLTFSMRTRRATNCAIAPDR